MNLKVPFTLLLGLQYILFLKSDNPYWPPPIIQNFFCTKKNLWMSPLKLDMSQFSIKHIVRVVTEIVRSFTANPARSAEERGKDMKMFSDETRERCDMESGGRKVV